MPFKKTRYAPTPSGYLHLGNLYSFALTAALAKKESADIVLRIDDMDRTRFRTECVEDIIDCLNFMSLPWQEGPKTISEFEHHYSQVYRQSYYENLLKQLVDTGQVFACRCSRSEIEHSGMHAVYPGTCKNKNIPLDEKDVCWRLHTGTTSTISIKEYGKGSDDHVLPGNMHNFIVRRKDGLPSYQVCSLVDDLYYGIDLIVRGKDLWDSSLSQLYLAQVSGHSDFLNTTFFHHPIIHSTDGKKLSKSAGDTSIKYMREQGLSAKDIYHLTGKTMGLNAFSWEGLAAF